MRYRYF